MRGEAARAQLPERKDLTLMALSLRARYTLALDPALSPVPPGGVRGGWDNLLAIIPGGSSVPLLPKNVRRGAHTPALRTSAPGPGGACSSPDAATQHIGGGQGSAPHDLPPLRFPNPFSSPGPLPPQRSATPC